MKGNFGYFFREGSRNMFSHGFMSFAAIGITVACLLIMGTFSLVAYNADYNLKNLQKENAILAQGVRPGNAVGNGIIQQPLQAKADHGAEHADEQPLKYEGPSDKAVGVR